MKKLLIKLLEPLDRFAFNYMVRVGLIKPIWEAVASAVIGGAIGGSSGGSGGGSVPAPLTSKEITDEVAVFLYGEEARGLYEGLGDPAFIDRVLADDAEATKKFSASQLTVLNQYLDGIPAGPNPRRATIERKLAGLRAARDSGETSFSERDLQAEADIFYPIPNYRGSLRSPPGARRNIAVATEKNQAYVEANKGRIGEKYDAQIAQLEAELENTPETIEEVKGLTKIKQEQAQVEGDIQRDQKSQTVASNLALLQESGQAYTDAFRDADPASRDLAIQASERAGQGQSIIGEKGEELIGRGVRDASVEEQAIRDAGIQRINTQRAEAGAGEEALLGSGLSNINAEATPAGIAEQELLGIGQANANPALRQASQAEQRLNEVGMSLTDLTPTQQEAMMGSRAMEFLQSTGELSPLEQIRNTRAARQGSIARGRGMDQSSMYNEMLARVAEESDKQESQIRLGMDLSQKQSDLRISRFNEGRNFLTDAEDLADTRRQEILEKQKVGISALTNAGGLFSARQDQQLNRQQFGLNAITQADNTEQRRIENQRVDEAQGARMLGQSAGLESGRIQEDLTASTLGANFLTQDENIQNQRTQTAFDMNRELAPNLNQVIIGQNPDTTSKAMQTTAAGAVQQGLQGLSFLDPNAATNTVLANQANATTAAGYNQQAQATKQAGQMDLVSSFLPLLINNNTPTSTTTTTTG